MKYLNGRARASERERWRDGWRERQRRRERKIDFRDPKIGCQRKRWEIMVTEGSKFLRNYTIQKLKEKLKVKRKKKRIDKVRMKRRGRKRFG